MELKIIKIKVKNILRNTKKETCKAGVNKIWFATKYVTYEILN
jgi:hypothetical protein